MSVHELTLQLLGEGAVVGHTKEVLHIPRDAIRDVATLFKGFETAIASAKERLDDIENMIKENKDVVADTDQYSNAFRGTLSSWRYIFLLDSSTIARTLSDAKTGKKASQLVNANVVARKIPLLSTAKKIGELQVLVNTARNTIKKYEAAVKASPNTSPYLLGQVINSGVNDLGILLRHYISVSK